MEPRFRALLAVAALSIFTSAASAQAVGEIPNRYELSGTSAQAEIKPDRAIFSKRSDLQTARRILLDPAETPSLKAQAAVFWSQNITDYYYKPRPEFWAMADRSGDFLDELFALPAGSAPRRHAIYAIFSNLSAQVRGIVVEDPEDPQWKEHWARAHRFVERGLSDNDARLREFFERFIPLPKPPKWKAIKARMRKIQQRILADDPGNGNDFRQVWATLQKIETSESDSSSVIERRIRKMKLDPLKKKRLLRYQAHILEHRLYTIWASLYPRFVEESGKQAIAGRGFKASPVKNGWPDY